MSVPKQRGQAALPSIDELEWKHKEQVRHRKVDEFSMDTPAPILLFVLYFVHFQANFREFSLG
jgi:hypothetical protein